LVIGFLLTTVLAPSAKAADPSPTPTQTSTPSPSPSQQQQQEYRAYVTMLAVDGTGTLGVVVQLRGCNSGHDACRRSVRDARTQVRKFESDLDRTPPPACLVGADAQFRDSLAFYDRGLDLVEEGSGSQDRLKVTQGAILIAVATWKLGAAMRAMRQSNC
jgi:hypothetical protein